MSFKTSMNDTLSERKVQEMGVPRGSILSVTLFNITINDIMKCLNPVVDRSLYVDDFFIRYRSKNIHMIKCQLQQYLNKINGWTIKNGFKFSRVKIKCMHSCQQQKIPVIWF